jgi:tetratricopeptide (TPR) repeat protein
MVRPLFLCAFVAAGLAAASAQRNELGRITFPASGPAAAQAHFVRGVLLLHSFEYDDAIAAFREAQRVAPGFAMAYWGEALSYSQPLWYNENLQRARQALDRLAPGAAARAAKAPTPREQAYLDAVERLFGEGTRAARHQAYADRMARLSQQYPDDDEARAFHALSLLATIPENARQPEVSLRAGALASEILARNPQHPGAAHYALHAYDDGVNNRLGLDAARIYAKIAPASSHALHMPSHVFLPLGMWDEAVASDEASYAASVAWAKRTGRSAAQHDFHSLSWLHYEYLQQGRFAKAREAEGLVRQALAASGNAGPAPPHHVESEIGRGYGQSSLQNELASMRARYVVESGSWAEMKGASAFGNVDELFAVGVSAASLGDVVRAEAAIQHLQTAGKTIGDAEVREVVGIMVEQLTAFVRLARGDRAAAIAALERSVSREAKRPRPIARPYPIKPAAELYGELLLLTGDARAAVAQFQAALARTPRRAQSLIGLAQAAHAAGNRAEAQRAAREFLSIWHRADSNRPELAEAGKILESMKN